MDFVQSLAIQTWIMYGIGVLLVAGRIESRRIQEGSIKKLWTEEYIMIFILLTFTLDCWAINEVARNGSNYMSPEAAASLDPEGVQQAIYGSKMTLVTEMFTLTTLWSLKGCLCLMFHRLTTRLYGIHLAVKIIAGYCVFAYIIVVSLFLGLWCRPFNQYWAVPVEVSQCATYYHHLIFATAWNISADLALLAVPFFIIPGSQLSLKRKIMINCVLGLGVFNILTAILNRYYNFAHPDSTEYLVWYVGEVATAVYVVNIPACWPILRKMVPTVFGSARHTSAGVSGRSSFRLRSDFRKSVHNTPIARTESEEDLAFTSRDVPYPNGSLAPVYSPDKDNYWASARGVEAVAESGPGIVKTVQVDVS